MNIDTGQECGMAVPWGCSGQRGNRSRAGEGGGVWGLVMPALLGFVVMMAASARLGPTTPPAAQKRPALC